MYENRIKHLEESHRILNKRIDGLEKTGVFDDVEMDILKKQRLQIKDQLVILKHKQQQHTDIND